MKIDRAVQITYFLLRVVAGLLFIQFGGLILFGWFGGIPGQPGTPSLISQTGIGGLLEFLGGIAIVLGLGTRPVAFILSGMMAVRIMADSEMSRSAKEDLLRDIAS